jgi:hypothetical protein
MLKQSLPYLIVLVVLIILFSLLGSLLLKKSNEADKLLVDSISKLKQIYSSPNLPSDELINSMKEYNLRLKEKYDGLRAKLPISKEVSIPGGVNRSLFFLEEFKNMKERVRSKTSGKKVQILTEDFGLPNVLPSETEALRLIKDLYITEMVVDLLIETGVNSLESITLGEVKPAAIYEEIPLSLSVTCDALSLAKLLYSLENTDKGFFIVRGFSLTSSMTGGDTTRASSMATRTPSLRYPARGEMGEILDVAPEKTIRVNLNLSIIRWK